MYSIQEGSHLLLEKEPTVSVVAGVRYRDVYLYRVQFADPDEANYDPFFSVDVNTGEVKDFSVLTDGDITEIAAAFADAA